MSCAPALTLLLLTLAQAQEPVVVARDDVVIERDCVVEVGEGAIEDANGDGVVHVRTPGVTVDFTGAHLRGARAGLDPDACTGLGIVVEAPGVTLRGARVSGFKVGILARGADGLTLEDCDVSGNFRQRLRSGPAVEDAGDWLWPHENDGKQWRTRYGAGICVEDSSGVTVRRCRAREGQNGLILDRVSESEVYDNDFSFLSGWGIAMWRSSDNVVSRNALDFCVRGYSHGVYNRGQDSAGLLMFEQCSRNRVIENSITHGGDGVFGFAGKEALGQVAGPAGFSTKGAGCNDNWFSGNDLSYAAAHGLEMTFSFRNHVKGNRLVGNGICGIWGGYSQSTEIQHNRFEANGEAGSGLERGGVNIEHATRTWITDNLFVGNACGVHLWWDVDEGLEDTPWIAANVGACAGNTVAGNRFEGDLVALHLRDCAGTMVGANEFHGVGQELRVDSGGEPVQAQGNVSFEGREVRLECPGEARPVGARGALAGREHIVMTEWGPYDWRRPLLWFEGRRDGVDVWRWLGDEALVSAEVQGPGVRLERREESDGLRLLVVPESEATVLPYVLAASSASGAQLRPGLLSSVRWDVRCFAWTFDPREDEDAWRAQADAAVAFEVGELDLAFGLGGPSQLDVGHAGLAAAGLPEERFGTLAESELSLPAGRWELRVTSDDGVRVRADGEVVLEDWTWHGPRTESAFLELDGARTVRLEVEHFELDGYAVLKVELRRADG